MVNQHTHEGRTTLFSPMAMYVDGRSVYRCNSTDGRIGGVECEQLVIRGLGRIYNSVHVAVCEGSYFVL